MKRRLFRIFLFACLMLISALIFVGIILNVPVVRGTLCSVFGIITTYLLMETVDAIRVLVVYLVNKRKKENKRQVYIKLRCRLAGENEIYWQTFIATTLLDCVNKVFAYAKKHNVVVISMTQED